MIVGLAPSRTATTELVRGRGFCGRIRVYDLATKALTGRFETGPGGQVVDMLVSTTGNSAVGIDLGTMEPAVGDALAGSQPISTGIRWTGSLWVYTPIAVDGAGVGGPLGGPGCGAAVAPG